MTDHVIDLPDVNVLIALTNPAHEFHPRAMGWFAETRRFGTTPVTELGLLRLLLNPAVMQQRLDATYAREMVRSVRSDPRHHFIADSTSLADPIVDVIGLVGHRQVTDLHLVNLSAAVGGRLVTFDRRIDGLLPAGAEHVVTL